jgi:superfamily II DNA/RNA helicase
VVIDEMDTILKDGFGPDLKRLMVPLQRKSEREKVQYLTATATMTNAVKRLMEAENFPQMRFLQSDDAHKTLPTLKHIMLDTKGTDKVQMLLDVLYSSRQSGETVMVFCNTVKSARAVEHSLREAGLPALSYHGEISSVDRKENLQKFKDGEVPLLVCTDIASRGLDMPWVDHVVMFDFPFNPIEYIHRCAARPRPSPL